jgi:hypothetical protein
VPHHPKGALATRAGAARKLGFSDYHVRRALRDGELELVSCGTKSWITDRSIEKLLVKLGLTAFPNGDGDGSPAGNGSPAGSDKHAC